MRQRQSSLEGWSNWRAISCLFSGAWGSLSPARSSGRRRTCSSRRGRFPASHSRDVPAQSCGTGDIPHDRAHKNINAAWPNAAAHRACGGRWPVSCTGNKRNELTREKTICRLRQEANQGATDLPAFSRVGPFRTPSSRRTTLRAASLLGVWLWGSVARGMGSNRAVRSARFWAQERTVFNGGAVINLRASQ
jgi:hypothetical protein